MQVIGVGFAMFFIDRVGRKKLLYFGSIACFACVNLGLSVRTALSLTCQPY
jgi:hypothetical protein